jgi:hypothetical protein
MKRAVASATKRASNPFKFLVLSLASEVSEVSINLCKRISRSVHSSILVTCSKSPDFAYDDT